MIVDTQIFPDHEGNKTEFKNRKKMVMESMDNEKLDALLIFRQESMYWLTGYDTFGFVYFQCLVLKNNGDLVLLTRAPDLRQAQNTSIIKDIRIWTDKENSNPAKELKNILEELNLKSYTLLCCTIVLTKSSNLRFIIKLILHYNRF